ncbi:MAG: hypothetical protein ACOZNI_18310 [Myxococcota bacterium]
MTAPGAGVRVGAGYGPRWLWVLQTVIFLGGGPLFLFPSITFPLFLAKPLPDDDLTVLVAENSFALLGVHATSVGVFTVFALMANYPEHRRRFARVFTVFLAAWTGVIVKNVHESPEMYGTATLALAACATVMALANLRWAFKRLPSDGPSPFGQVASAPSWTFVAWIACAISTFVAGVLVLSFSPEIVRHMVGEGAASQLAAQQTRFSGAYLVSYGALCLDAAVTTRAAVWRPMAAVLAFWPLAAVAVALVRWDFTVYATFGYALLAGLVLLAVANLAVARSPVLPWADDVSLPLPGWEPVDLVAGPMMGAQTLGTKRRASHLVGVGAKGTLHVSPDPRLPAHAFFGAPRELPMVARFANLTEKDDASLDVRGAAVSIVDPATGERFDMVMNTGSFAPVRHVVDFAAFVASKFVPQWGSKMIVETNQLAREGGIAGLRRAPESFTRLYFHSQIVRWWFTPKGALYLARYRLAPEDLGPESGLLGEEDCTHIWARGRLPGDTRAPDYLRKELADRFAGGPVRFRLQAQLLPAGIDARESLYDASVDWPEDDVPWLDLGAVELAAALTADETERLDFSPGNHPASCGVPPARGLFDRRSLGDSEVRVMYALQRLRGWMYGAFGMPS